MNWCPNCYKAYDEGEKICKSCGAKLTEESNNNSDTVKAQVLTDDSAIVKDDIGKAANSAEEISIEEISTEELSIEEISIEEISIEEKDSTAQEEYNLDENHLDQVELNSEENDNKQDKLNYKLEDDNLNELNNEVDGIAQNKLDYEEIEVEKDEFIEDELNEVAFNENEFNENELNEVEVNGDDDEATSELDELELENPTFLEKDTLTDEEEELISAIKHPVSSNTYIKKEEEYKDLLSAGYTFFTVSIIGLVLLVINALGYINIFSGLLSNIVMGALFIAFLIIGISSFYKANKVKSQVAQENQLTESINNWLSENVTLELLDSSVNPDDNEEVQFMQKLDKMKDLVTDAFGELDELYLDRIVEEFYNNNFDEE